MSEGSESRRHTDPIYRMLLYGLDDVDGEPYIVLLLRQARAMLEKRYGTPFCESRWIRHMWRVLLEQPPTRTTLPMYVFVASFVLSREHVMFEAMSQLYVVDNEDASLFGARGPQQLFSYVHHYLRPALDAHLMHPTNKYTVVAQMDQFVEESIMQYVMGPFGAPQRQ